MTEQTKQKIADAFDKIAATFDTVIPFFATFGARLVAAADLRQGERVLDLACGRGACLREAATAVGASGYVLGVDISDQMVSRTAADLRAQGIGQAQVRVGDAEHLDLADASFDAIVCGFGVFFFPDPRAALAECLRVLRPGGRLAASTFVGGRGGFPWTYEVAREMGKEGSPLSTSPVRMAEGLRAALGDVSFERTQTSDFQARFVFPDVEAVIEWNRSTGQRQVIDSLTETELLRFRELIAERLKAHKMPEGFELIQSIHLTTAYRPL
jgi:SAM-dependent methyltransferase